MSLYDYRKSLNVSEGNPPFASLIMAALRTADDVNATKLWCEWPEICEELQKRYNTPGGKLEGEHS